MDGGGVMTTAGLLAVLLVLGVWIMLRRRGAGKRAANRATPDDGAGVPEPSIEDVAGTAGPAIHSLGAPSVQAINALVTERLWRLAFRTAPGQQVTPEHAQIRETVLRALQAEKLDEKYFPRRPTLMPQLLRAMKDPDVG